MTELSVLVTAAIDSSGSFDLSKSTTGLAYQMMSDFENTLLTAIQVLELLPQQDPTYLEERKADIVMIQAYDSEFFPALKSQLKLMKLDSII